MATICPHCNIEVSEHLIEAEDGCCPECGAIIGAQNDYMEDDIAEYEDDGETSEGFELDDEFMDDYEDGDEDDESYDAAYVIIFLLYSSCRSWYLLDYECFSKSCSAVFH